MATPFAGRHPALTGLLVLLGLLLLGEAAIYLATDHGRALLPTLERPTLNIRNITRERIDVQLAVRLHNPGPLDLNIDSLRYLRNPRGWPSASPRPQG